MTHRPVLLLTLRRTGGTTLANFLSGLTDQWAMAHEPFNRGRKFGEITRQYDANGDHAALRADIAGALQDRPGIKHCIDNLPYAVTAALIAEAEAAGYAFLVLTRKDIVARQMSLMIAQATGAWGKRSAQEIYPEIRAGDRPVKPIDLKDVRKQTVHEITITGRLLLALRYQQIPHEWVVYEEFYAPDRPVESRAQALAARLGHSIGADHPSLQAFTRSSSQKSASISDLIPNADEARAMIEAVQNGLR